MGEDRRKLLIGCCGWAQARAAYFAKFPVVELQETFYEPPSPRLAQKWRDGAPPSFSFTMKAWQLITHAATSPTYRRLKRTHIEESRRANYGSFQSTDEVRRAWDTTLEIARILRACAIVFQCPKSFVPNKANLANLEEFFKTVERGDSLFVWEPRGDDWTPDLVRSICRELDLVHCVDPLQAERAYGGVAYYRLHGIGGYHYKYSDEELLRLRAVVSGHLEAGERVFVMFNNTEMKDDAARFQDMLKHAHGL